VVQVASSWLAFDLICCTIRDIFKEKTSLFEKTLKVDVTLSSFKKRRCLLIEKDIHQFRGQASRISDWERVNPVQEYNPSGKFLLLADIFKCKSSKLNDAVESVIFCIFVSLKLNNTSPKSFT